MMNFRRVHICMMALVLFANLSTATFSQERATLRGRVSDEFGASIVGATVTLSDAAGRARTTAADGEGTYTFTGLTVGKYRISATATGFAASENVDVDI